MRSYLDWYQPNEYWNIDADTGQSRPENTKYANNFKIDFGIA